MILALYERPDGVDAAPGHRVVYDLERNEAHFGEKGLAGPGLVWTLSEAAEDGAALAAKVELDLAVEWLMRCDRIDFPPGGVAYLHTHPGPGIRRLLHGTIHIETQGSEHDYGPADTWFETGPDPVYASASSTDDTAFVRVMLLPREWEGKRTIRYVNPGDEELPKLQRPTLFFDQPIEL